MRRAETQSCSHLTCEGGKGAREGREGTVGEKNEGVREVDNSVRRGRI